MQIQQTPFFLPEPRQPWVSGILVLLSVYNSLKTHKLEFVIVLAAEIINFKTQ